MSFIWALPGFLGLPTDWDFLGCKNIGGLGLNHFPWTSLSEWLLRFHQEIDSQKKENALLMGYSLGGRLALHSLVHSPQKWKAAILISTHPGLSDLQMRQARQKEDEAWAKRFEEEEWESLMQAWNQRPVFAGDRFCFDRREEEYDRRWLAHLLREGSLAKQPDFRSQIASLSLPLLWITGEADQLYCKLAEALIFKHPTSCWIKMEQAGHRVPWEQPEKFLECVLAFLKKINRETFL